jgi:hypothetical protein
MRRELPLTLSLGNPYTAGRIAHIRSLEFGSVAHATGESPIRPEWLLRAVSLGFVRFHGG